MANIQRNFIAGRMNKSLDERLVPNGEYVNAVNVRLGSTEESEIGAVLGGAIGATIGGNLSKNLQKVDGIQLTINLDDGRTVSIVQEIGDYKFSVGDLVEVISTKGKTRVSPSGIN